MNLFFVLLALAGVAVLVWNFVPSVREKMRGLTTTMEGIIVAVAPFVGNAFDAFQDTDWKSFIPADKWPYIVAALAGWFIFKRVVTTTPVGSGDAQRVNTGK